MREIFCVIADKAEEVLAPKDGSRAWYRFGETYGRYIYWALLFGGGFVVGALFEALSPACSEASAFFNA